MYSEQELADAKREVLERHPDATFPDDWARIPVDPDKTGFLVAFSTPTGSFGMWFGRDGSVERNRNP